MALSDARLIASSAREAWARDGAFRARSILSPAEIDAMAAIFDWSVANPSDNAYEFSPTAAARGRFYADINNPQIPQGGTPYDELILKSAIARMLADIWGSDTVWFLYEQVLLKEGEATRRTPWHQDSSYLPIAGDMVAVVWLTLDPVTPGNTLEFVKGSHRGPIYDGSAFDPEDDTAPIFGDGSMPRLPDIEASRADWPIASYAAEPGDALVFHPATLHGGAHTDAGSRRRTISMRFFGDDAVYRPHVSNGVRGIGIEGDTIWDVLSRELQPGQPLRHPMFMQAWSRH